jgi:hypothetical protein
MAGFDWNDIEIAVLLFYHSRGLCYAACGELVSSKFHSSRTKVACQGRLARLKSDQPDIYNQNSKTFVNAAVDAYIQSLAVEDLRTYLALEEEERAILQKV